MKTTTLTHQKVNHYFQQYNASILQSIMAQPDNFDLRRIESNIKSSHAKRTKRILEHCEEPLKD